MDAVGRTVRWLHAKRKFAAFLFIMILGSMFWFQLMEHGTVTWCPALTPTTVVPGMTWESLAVSSHLPVRTLKMCNWQNPVSSMTSDISSNVVWIPNYMLMMGYVILLWLALQSFNMPALVSLVLLYVLMQVLMFGIDFSLCPGTTHVLGPGDSIWKYSTTRVKGVVFCNLGLVGADFTKLPIGFAYRDPYSIWTGPVIVLLALAGWQIFKKDA